MDYFHIHPLMGLFGLRRIIHPPPSSTIFAVTKQPRDKESVRQLTLPVLSHRPDVCLCVELCVISMPRPTHRSREDALVNEERGPRSPRVPFPSLSSLPFFPWNTDSSFLPLSLPRVFTLVFLSLPKLAQLSVSPPQLPQLSALPERETPQQYRSQVKRKNRLRSQWTVAPWKTIIPLFFLEPFSAVARTGKDKPLSRWLKRVGSPPGQQPLRHLLLLTIASRATMINTLAHTRALAFTTPSLHCATPSFVCSREPSCHST